MKATSGAAVFQGRQSNVPGMKGVLQAAWEWKVGPGAGLNTVSSCARGLSVP
ncbi:hypothetical protein GCM10010840_27590 [Deinococcus aerolatus]|uniref:Uncharacterized protein n=1 Tax=Deinococcus aerolatus TaxID=522487 RepID=A0ABQ2GDT6_9DEIO|nr:hypothetical protein GCM10010840_27590 [Deinococcus aerolatus]